MRNIKSKVNIGIVCIFITAILLMTGCGVNNTANNETEAVQDTKNDEIQITLTQNAQYPDYYEEEVLKTVRTVQETVTNDSVNYIFITDLHLDSDEASTAAAYRQLNAAVDVANNSDIDFICVGGDIYNGRHSEENGKENAMQILRNVSEILTACNKPVFILHGNHDDNSFSGQADASLLYDADYVINKDEWYSVTMAYFPQYATEYQEGYFYYDLPEKNVRVVCLNMSDCDDTIVDGEQNEIGMHFYGYKDAQIDWLLNKAMAREDCQYFIMSHDAFDYPEGYGELSNRDTLENILTAAYAHQNYSGEKFAKDFSSWNGKLVLYNSGHLHMERTYINEDMGGLPVLNTEKGKVASHAAWGQFGSKGYWTTQPRTADTISEALLDVVISKPGEIDIVRFGAGEDTSVKY